MIKKIFVKKGFILSLFFILFLTSLVIAQENCLGNLTLDCSIYNETECINNYYYNLDYYQCYFNISECLVNETNCIFVNLTTTITTTVTTTTSTTTTTIINSSVGYINVILLDELGLYSGRHIYLFQNSSNVSRFIQEINLSTPFKIDNGIDYIISIESKNIDILTNPLDNRLQGFLLRYFWVFVFILVIISSIILLLRRRKK